MEVTTKITAITYPIGSLIPIDEILRYACGASILLISKSKGVPRSSKTLRKTKLAPAMYPGIESGNTILLNKPKPLEPKLCADSSIDLSILFKLVIKLIKMNGK